MNTMSDIDVIIIRLLIVVAFIASCFYLPQILIALLACVLPVMGGYYVYTLWADDTPFVEEE